MEGMLLAFVGLIVGLSIGVAALAYGYPIYTKQGAGGVIVAGLFGETYHTDKRGLSLLKANMTMEYRKAYRT